MKKIMSIKEIYSKFVSEWVLLEDPITTKNLEVKKGKVLYHSKDRDEVYRKAIDLRPTNSAILYTGSVPKGTVIVL